jgi:hypothetical protein
MDLMDLPPLLSRPPAYLCVEDCSRVGRRTARLKRVGNGETWSKLLMSGVEAIVMLAISQIY